MTQEQIARLLELKAENMRRDAARHLESADRKDAPDNDFRRGYAAALDHLADMMHALAQIVRTPDEETKQ